MIRAACCPAIMAFLLVFLGISAIRVQAQPASGNATAMMRERSPVAAVHTGPTMCDHLRHAFRDDQHRVGAWRRDQASEYRGYVHESGADRSPCATGP